MNNFFRYLLIVFVILLAVLELLSRFNVISYGALDGVNAFYNFFYTISNVGF